MNPLVSPRLIPERYFLAALLLFVFLNGLLWSLTIPFDGAPDEIHKYEIVYFIWKSHHLPAFGPSADVYIRQAPGTRDGYVYGAAATYPCGAYLLAASFMYLTPSNAPQSCCTRHDWPRSCAPYSPCISRIESPAHSSNR